MIKAFIFDCYGVLYVDGGCNEGLTAYIKERIKPQFVCGILSNASRSEIDSLLPQEVQGLFDVQILSGDVGCCKPEKEIYSTAVEKLSVEFSEVVFVDDRQDFTRAAKDLGMHIICYRDMEQFRFEFDLLMDKNE